MAFKAHNQIKDSLEDDMAKCLQRLHAIPTWTAHKYQVFAQFERLAHQNGYLKFTADMRDYRLSGSGNSCLYQVPFSQRGALSVFAGKFIRVVCGGKTNRYSGRVYYAKPVSKRFWRNQADYLSVSELEDC